MSDQLPAAAGGRPSDPIVVEIPAPEYTVDAKPDYMAVGTRVDALIAPHFADGPYVVRAIGSSDHQGKDLGQLAATILATGTDKYDPDRLEVAHKSFAGYNHDFHASSAAIAAGAFVPDPAADYPSMFGDTIYHFYEHTPLDRGYAVRIDLLMFYYPDHLEAATLVGPNKELRAELASHLYRFKDPARKRDALAGLVKICP